jgi:hypothetical protein
MSDAATPNMPMTATEARAKTIESSRQRVMDMFNTYLRKSVQDGKTSFNVEHEDLSSELDEIITLREIAAKLGYGFKNNERGGRINISW